MPDVVVGEVGRQGADLLDEPPLHVGVLADGPREPRQRVGRRVAPGHDVGPRVGQELVPRHALVLVRSVHLLEQRLLDVRVAVLHQRLVALQRLRGVGEEPGEEFLGFPDLRDRHDAPDPVKYGESRAERVQAIESLQVLGILVDLYPPHISIFASIPVQGEPCAVS